MADINFIVWCWWNTILVNRNIVPGNFNKVTWSVIAPLNHPQELNLSHRFCKQKTAQFVIKIVVQQMCHSTVIVSYWLGLLTLCGAEERNILEWSIHTVKDVIVEKLLLQYAFDPENCLPWMVAPGNVISLGRVWRERYLTKRSGVIGSRAAERGSSNSWRDN